MRLTLSVLLSLLAASMVIAGGVDPARRTSGNNVAVCTLPAKTDPAEVSNLARGITFTMCPPSASTPPPPPPGVHLVFVSITPASGFQQQFWDAGGDNFDAYWLKQYLEPQLPDGFKVDCWQAPQGGGCAKPSGGLQPLAVPPGARMKLVVAASSSKLPGKRGGDAADSSDDVDLVPLGDPSLGL